jgi:hypothetical protein
MTPDEQELAKQGMEVAFSPVRDVCEKLFGQPADEIGAMFRDFARVFRFRQTVRLAKLLQDVKKEAAALGISIGKVPDKTLLPLLEGASLEEHGDMQEQWKWLLLNAADANKSVPIPPSFSEILRQLSPRDARLLDSVYNLVRAKPLDFPIDKGKLIELFGPHNGFEFHITLDTLLGFHLMAHSPSAALATHENQTILMQHRDLFVITILGLEFVRACREPSPDLEAEKTKVRGENK